MPNPPSASTAPEAPSAPVRPADATAPASPAAPSAPDAPAAAALDKQDAGIAGGPPTFQWPLPKDYTNVRSGFGQRTDPTSGDKKGEFHPGIDLPAPEGVDIYAAAAGHVDVAREVSGYGNAVYIGHDNTWSTRYAHASELLTNVGNTVQAGELIAKVGKTGKVTGPHLHFEVRETGTAKDPLQYLTRPQ